MPQFDDHRQVAFELYNAIQRADILPQDLISQHDLNHIRQLVRRAFEANGMVFTRARFTAAAHRVTAQNLGATPPTPEVWRFEVAPVDRALLNIAVAGNIKAYRIQVRRGAAGNFIDLDPIVTVTPDNQPATIEVNFTGARRSGLLTAAGPYHCRVLARDEFGAWDTFADDFSSNTDPVVTSNDTWQINRLNSRLPAPITIL